MDAPLNFAKEPFRNERLPGILFGILAAALVVGTLWHAVVLTRYLMREAEELDVTVQGMEERRSSLVADINRARAALEAERSDVMSQRVAFLADTYRQKGFSWTGLFNQLEAVVPPNVRITSISPSAAEGEIEVRLTIVGRSLEDLLALVRNLEQSRFFGTVMPLNEAQQEEEGTVSSTVTLRYHPEEPPADLETGQDEAIEPSEPSEPTEEDPLEDEDLIEDNDA
jgi:Tfp pilus assembly protein PilN